MLLSSNLVAQNYSLQLYNFNNVAQSTLLNPATKVQSNITIGLANAGLHINSPQLNLASVFAKNTSLNSLFDQLSSQSTDLNGSLQLGFFAGFRLLEKNYISLGVYTDVDVFSRTPKDLVKILWEGTSSSVNQQLQIAPKVWSSLNLVYHLGFARQINKNLNVGMRIKLITGVQNIQSGGKQVNLTITDDDPLVKYRYTLDANYDVRFNNYSLFNGNNDGGGDFGSRIFQNGINGFGFDFGVTYKVNPKLALSASVLDIGKMTWNKDVARIGKYGTNIEFKGVNFVGLGNTNREGQTLTNRIDSLVKVIEPDTTFNAYSNSLNTRAYLGAEYSLATYTKLGATLFGHFNPMGSIDYAVGLWASHKFWSIVDLRLGWSAFNDDFANVGVGLSLNLANFQVYAMTENVLAAFEYDQSHRFNIQVGVNINLGLNLDKDRDGVPNQKDKCVKIPGLDIFDGCPDTDKDSVPDYKDSCRLDSGAVSNNGCPLDLDTDGDSVLDINDSCPNIKGLKTAFGCPDQDEDGVPDYKDSCIDVPGTATAFGCPDQDEDGIPDKQDSCIGIAGREEFFGCPTEEALIQSRYDKDGDRTPDSLDRCPDLYGDELLMGCPDYDGDGISDDLDSCIEVAGELEFNGCPDTDNDGVPDYLDACITLSGSIDNNGCPVNINPTNNNGQSNNINLGEENAEGEDDDFSGNQDDDNSVIKNIVLNPDQSKVLVEAFKNLQFRFQSSTILESSYPVLDNLAQLLLSKPESKLILIGYTDNTGSELFNQILSYQRANSVKTYLEDRGVTNSIQLYGLGENNPVADNATAEGRFKNRRVEMAIVE